MVWKIGYGVVKILIFVTRTHTSGCNSNLYVLTVELNAKKNRELGIPSVEMAGSQAKKDIHFRGYIPSDCSASYWKWDYAHKNGKEKHIGLAGCFPASRRSFPGVRFSPVGEHQGKSLCYVGKRVAGMRD